MATHDPQASSEKTTPALQPAGAGDAPVAQQLGLNLGSIPWAKLLKLALELGGFILTKLPQAQSAAGAKGQAGGQEYHQLQQEAKSYVQALEQVLAQEDQADQAGQGELSEPK